MKKALILGLLIIAFGCTPPNVESRKTDYVVNESGATVEIIIIDSCEYIFIPMGHASWGSHKGNCTFCKQRILKNEKR